MISLYICRVAEICQLLKNVLLQDNKNGKGEGLNFQYWLGFVKTFSTITIFSPFIQNFTFFVIHYICTKGEFCSKYNEIYSSPPIVFDTTESFSESCKQSLITALSKKISCVKFNWRWTVYFLILRAKFTFNIFASLQ